MVIQYRPERGSGFQYDFTDRDPGFQRLTRGRLSVQTPGRTGDALAKETADALHPAATGMTEENEG
jgi:hypothetical protein